MTTGYEDFSTATTQGFGPLGSAANAAGSVPFWGENPNAWDKVTIAGTELPGIAEVEAKVEAKVDHKNVPGTHGAKLTFIGYEPAKVKVKITLWTEAQLKTFQDLVPTIRPKDTILPVDISHPALALVGISSVKVLVINTPKHQADDSKVVEIECIENWPSQKSKRAKVSSSSNSIDNLDNAITQKYDAEHKKPSALNASYQPTNASFLP